MNICDFHVYNLQWLLDITLSRGASEGVLRVSVREEEEEEEEEVEADERKPKMKIITEDARER